MKINITHGTINGEVVTSATTKVVSATDYYAMNPKPLIVYNGKILCNLHSNLFGSNNIFDACDASNYYYINDDFFNIPVCFYSSTSIVDKTGLNHTNKQDKPISQYNCYFMLDLNTGCVKIGKSKNPKERESQFKNANPNIKLLFYVKLDIEAALHEEYKEKRFKGEWFSLSKNDIDAIRAKYQDSILHVDVFNL